jgi:hypothetical protein
VVVYVFGVCVFGVLIKTRKQLPSLLLLFSSSTITMQPRSTTPQVLLVLAAMLLASLAPVRATVSDEDLRGLSALYDSTNGASWVRGILATCLCLCVCVC